MIPIKLEDLHEVIMAKGTRLVVKRDIAPKKTSAGLHIDHANLKPNTGKVLSAGPRCEQVKPGMRIIFGKVAGTELKINNETILIMHEQDVWYDLDTNQPFHDKVLIKLDEMPEIIKGIHIPETVSDTPKMGTVISVGPDCIETKPAERCLIGSFAGLQIGANLILREADLFASL